MKHPWLSNSSRRFLINIRFLAVVAIVLWIASRQIVGIGKYAVSSLHFILDHSSASYDGKMGKHLGASECFSIIVWERTKNLFYRQK